MCDPMNFDFIKQRIKDSEAMKNIYSSFGILNLFCPFRSYGSYMLRLDIYEERQVCKMLMELSRSEGWGHWQDAKLNGKPATVNAEFSQTLPATGVFEGSYVCPTEKEKHEVRMKLGIKYLGWPTPEVE